MFNFIKPIYKLFIYIIIFLLALTSYSFATENVPAQENSLPTENVTYNDLYIKEDNYNITNSIDGNVYSFSKNFNITPISLGQSISGNLFAISKNITINSDVAYLEGTDEFGNKVIDQVNTSSIIYGNGFILADKFILEAGCEIEGDLYICANEVVLEQNSIIYGNVYMISNKIDLNCQVGGDAYISCKNFNMDYFGFIYRDLYLNSTEVSLGGYLYRNAFIDCKTLSTKPNFISVNTFNVKNCTDLKLSGELQGNLKLISENIEISPDCKILGNIDYSSNSEIDFGSRSFRKYKLYKIF